ncbi:tRNA pseudouridine(55) synthase TruB [Corynebacterium ammoniagenes]|uniref:tRNA pseudouridine synthase B n=1 Tax=Corynebacterium ammoniagenes DSM 20306 TaxID=649754 RepID=A0ABP2IN92_CORAM|nr:tRNA pseudouridine(55) synthase TruB [Corynebacterium ammoniagenes]APT82441.1 pseudouridine synthase [Corynebacterium ammoniagenes DSM 20306]AQS73524.1 tRNA pseudouridine(55) synthase TruB [Corynebacterium ammoniagenes]EFG82654.1 tRNA pseudouridine synthase B [Corynebacterium ammoniagenes DSM 20306]
MTDSGLVVVDKPAGMTSHDVVSRVRREFGTRKVGHAGTLDPMATGVLILGIERGTKFLAHMVAATKAYEATIRLGASTTTDDFESDILSETSAAHITDSQVHEEIAKLSGEIMQKPAKVSAIKIDGKRAYQRVRDGEDIDIPARPVTVSRFEVHNSRMDPRELDVTVECSSGTYIRSLARDLGAALGVGGHLTALRRTAVGPFLLDDASPIDAMQLSLSLDEALVRCYPRLDVTAEEAHKLAMGQWLEPRGLKGTHAAVGPDGRSVALIKEQGKRLATVFVAHPSTLS